MDVDGPTLPRDPKYQTTCSVFVVWIVFYYFTHLYCIAYILNRDFPQDRLVNSMSREFECVTSKFLANLFNMCHNSIIL